MLLDLHAHSSGISHCCRIDARENILRAKAAGLDGMVLTNHYTKPYVKDGDALAFAHRYVDEYYAAKAAADELGATLLFGIEVTMEKCNGAHLLVYGVEDSFVYEHADMYDYTQKELWDAVKAAGGALVQAHPYRREVNALLDTSMLDGVEVNCHPLYNYSHMDDMTDIAAKNNLVLTCGGDYHADTERPICGTYLPDNIAQNRRALADYLLTAKTTELCVHEPHTDTPVRVTYTRGVGIVISDL
jgi:predicted metal-dependent phosphoesterase TrpH